MEEFVSPHSDLPDQIKNTQETDQELTDALEKPDPQFGCAPETDIATYDGLVYVPEPL